MNTATLELQERVIEELAFDPRVSSDDIAVSVREGVVTLRGTVSSLNEKWNAEDAVKRVSGVRGIADELIVDLPATHVRSDTDVAVALEHRFKSNPLIPGDVTFLVQDGNVTLSGDVRWQYQAREAVHEARRVSGVRDVANLIAVKPMVSLTAEEIRRKIHEALERSANLEAEKITVSVVNGIVTLDGTVRTWLGRELAADAAWSIPGVTHVENCITIVP
jgi:osmotically-inducible protein OsmY